MSLNYVYDTYEIDTVLESIETVEPWLLGRYFSETKSFDTETIEWDMVDGGQTIAPFVSPLSRGQETGRKGYHTESLKPAYIKLRHTLRPTDGFTRAPGEARGGTLSPQERLDRILAQQIAYHENMIMARKEWMAVRALTDGGYTVEGESYAKRVVSFNQAAALRANVGVLWGAAGSTPQQDIEDHSLLINERSRGAVVDELVMTGNVWKNVKKHQDFMDEMDRDVNRLNTTSIDTGPRNRKKGAQWMGTLSGRFDIWVYDDYYENRAGANVSFMDQDKVLFLSSSIEGRQYQGAILDHKANMEPRDLFHKTWENEDPSGTNLLTQTAPLVAPRRVNSWGTLTVL